MVVAKNLSKTFSFPIRTQGNGFLKNLFNPDRKKVEAVKNISFEISKGEAVAFIGPNGAGKSTTIKMLTGILYPTSGYLNVAGFDPQEQRKKLAYKIGTVFGQRSQLIFNLPVRDSFKLFGAVYELEDKRIEKRTRELSEIFNLF